MWRLLDDAPTTARTSRPPGALLSQQRVTIAAVIATGVVGVVAPVITWQATKDTQDAAAAAAIVRSDREDLRDVLDQSASNLDNARIRAVEIGGIWLHATKPLPQGRLDHLSALTTAAEFNLDQLQIRLGSESAAYRAYNSALLRIEHMAVKFHGPADHEQVSIVRRASRRAISAQERFGKEAHSLAGEATTP